MYDSTRPMTEDSAILPQLKKGKISARMAQEVMSAHLRGEFAPQPCDPATIMDQMCLDQRWVK